MEKCIRVKAIITVIFARPCGSSFISEYGSEVNCGVKDKQSHDLADAIKITPTACNDLEYGVALDCSVSDVK